MERQRTEATIACARRKVSSLTTWACSSPRAAEDDRDERAEGPAGVGGLDGERGGEAALALGEPAPGRKVNIVKMTPPATPTRAVETTASAYEPTTTAAQRSQPARTMSADIARHADQSYPRRSAQPATSMNGSVDERARVEHVVLHVEVGVQLLHREVEGAAVVHEEEVCARAGVVGGRRHDAQLWAVGANDARGAPAQSRWRRSWRARASGAGRAGAASRRRQSSARL